MKLNEKVTLPATVITPEYEHHGIKTRIAHIGFGAFHRAHQAVYADILASEHNSDWGYCEINLIGGEQQINDLKQQNLLYSVSEMSSERWQGRVIGVVKQALHIRLDGLESVLEALAQPDIAIVSLTVTEKGYCCQPATGQLDKAHPAILHDTEEPLRPQSAPGVILAALNLRRRRGLPAFTVMSCDNMPENGHVTRNVITQLARLQNPELADWIEAHVGFPSTMVDRIVPAVTPETLKHIESVLGGVKDPVGVACEPFRQWVIEDNFPQGRPQWEKAGAELVQNVLPYEEMKLRMLNGSHSFLAYLGYLAGYNHISDCMQDDNFVAAARHLMVDEQAPTLHIHGVDLASYADSLLRRYRNAALKHRTWQIAMDGTQKLPQRMLDSVRWHLKKGDTFPYLAMGIAGWMRFVGGVDEKGKLIEISDPLIDEINSVVSGSKQGEARVDALLKMESVFGMDLPADPDFVKAVKDAYQQLLEKGARKSVAALLSGQR